MSCHCTMYIIQTAPNSYMYVSVLIMLAWLSRATTLSLFCFGHSILPPLRLTMALQYARTSSMSLCTSSSVLVLVLGFSRIPTCPYMDLHRRGMIVQDQIAFYRFIISFIMQALHASSIFPPTVFILNMLTCIGMHIYGSFIGHSHTMAHL